ncbi:hypothetical protein [Microseira wollei]|uniref:HTH cro/C1-type domain-containing protein n=1 Tax=Microseira wollei NIES-4236 TaxID=2530354 RepID=A0AAV3XLS8_9CYAN|nr:hypothetical protein [Microseira wollei]GET40482.1 hypothetical protein MiSe_52910 [Microseira wollei NIES-4236]
MPKSKYAKKRWRLTKDGKERFNHALFVEGIQNLSDHALAATLGCSRDTIAAIRNEKFAGNRGPLENLFIKLKLTLTDEDCVEVIDDNPPNPSTYKIYKTS